MYYIIGGNDIKPGEETESQQQQENIDKQQEGMSLTEMPAIRKQLQNPSEAKEGLAKLQEHADNRNIEAMFILSRLYAASSGAFTLGDEYLTMQANLKGVISPNPAKAHKLLVEIVSDKPNFYPALYELACNYYEGPNLTGGEARNLKYAKDLLDKAYKYASEAEDPVYVNKISALLRKY